MNTRPIFPYNSQLLQNLVLRTPPQELPKPLPKLGHRAPAPSQQLGVPNRLGMPLTLLSRSGAKLNEATAPISKLVNSDLTRAIIGGNSPDSISNDWVKRIENTLTNALSEVLQNFTQVISTLLENTLRDLFKAEQPAVNTSSAPQLLGQNGVEAGLDGIEPASQPNKKKKKGGFFKKLGKTLFGFAKKGLNKLAGSAVKIVSRYFGLSG